MERVVDVDTGEVQADRGNVILRSNAIGSCVVVAAILPGSHTGALAHILLPGKAPENCTESLNRYAFNALTELFEKLKGLSASKQDVITFMIGGANVLKRKDDQIGEFNIASVESILRSFELAPLKQEVGGEERRSVVLNLRREQLCYTVGESKEMLLWKNNLS